MQLESTKQQGELQKVQGQAMIEQLKQESELKKLYVQAMLEGNLKNSQIRTQGDEDAQLAAIEGKIKKDIERMKLENQQKKMVTSKK
jgi:hypothetical protein